MLFLERRVDKSGWLWIGLRKSNELEESMSSEKPISETRIDAPWDDEKAFAYIERLFNNPKFLSVAQEKIHNQGEPISFEKMSENFTRIMASWSKKESLF
ncbi:MAG: hypothetical protein LBC55_01300 [Desulfovibrio sp.]|jgi:hypothetical protein|nr:hypothetical protein [Desulfovibrio sp.]